MADAPEKWDFFKQFSITRQKIWKVANYVWIILIIVLLVFGILWVKNLLFPPIPDNINQPAIHVDTGGTLHYTNVQQSSQKRAWWRPIPYVAIHAGATNKQTDSFNFEPEYGGEVGIRWDF
jgi:hypothetical protein